METDTKLGRKPGRNGQKTPGSDPIAEGTVEPPTKRKKQTNSLAELGSLPHDHPQMSKNGSQVGLKDHARFSRERDAKRSTVSLPTRVIKGTDEIINDDEYTDDDDTHDDKDNHTAPVTADDAAADADDGDLNKYWKQMGQQGMSAATNREDPGKPLDLSVQHTLGTNLNVNYLQQPPYSHMFESVLPPQSLYMNVYSGVDPSELPTDQMAGGIAGPLNVAAAELYGMHFWPNGMDVEGQSKTSIAQQGTPYGQKERRTRTVYTESQLQILEEEFKRNDYPSRKDRDVIAAKLGLGENCIQNWFTNKRAKMKQMQNAETESKDTTSKMVENEPATHATYDVSANSRPPHREQPTAIPPEDNDSSGSKGSETAGTYSENANAIKSVPFNQKGVNRNSNAGASEGGENDNVKASEGEKNVPERSMSSEREQVAEMSSGDSGSDTSKGAEPARISPENVGARNYERAESGDSRSLKGAETTNARGSGGETNDNVQASEGTDSANARSCKREETTNARASGGETNDNIQASEGTDSANARAYDGAEDYSPESIEELHQDFEYHSSKCEYHSRKSEHHSVRTRECLKKIMSFDSSLPSTTK